MHATNTLPTRQWSTYQEAVFDAVKNGSGHLVVRARAGSGKTTTILESLRRMRPGQRVLLCAFNAAIAKELESRAPRGVTVRTLHALGFGALMGAWPRTSVDKLRGRKLLAATLGTRASFELGMVLSLCKARLTNDLGEVARMLAGKKLPMSPDGSGEMTPDRVALAILETMERACTRDGTIDFDDQVFVPVAMGLPVGQFDMVLVDETQDMNAAQLALAQSALAPGGG